MMEYLVLLGVFAMMFFLSFVPGYLEYRLPRDPGPLHIDLSRTVEPRSEALHFRMSSESLGKSQEWTPVPPANMPQWTGGALTYQRELKGDGGSFKVLRIDQDLTIPAGTTIESAIIVQGNLVSEQDCSFREWVYVKGQCQIGRSNKLTSVASGSDMIIGEESEIFGFADSDGNVRIGEGCIVRGLVGSGGKITLEGSCEVKKLNGRVIIVAKSGG